MAGRKWTARDVEGALYRHFIDRYAVVFQVTARSWEGAESTRRIDALLVRRSSADTKTTAKRNVTAAAGVLAAGLGQATFAGGDSLFPDLPPPAPPPAGDDGGLDRLAIEIKVSRQDFLNDVRDPAKQQPWRELAHRHAYAVPAGLVGVNEVPRGSGLLIVKYSDSGYLPVEWARRAPRSATARPLSLGQQLDAFFRWSRAEATVRGYGGYASERTDDPDDLRRRLAQVEAELTRARSVAEQRLEKVGQLKQRLAAFEPLPCSTCGRPLRPARLRKADTHLRWEHVAADEAVCVVQRTAVAQAEHDQEVAESATEGQRPEVVEFMRKRRLYVWPPQPVYPGDGEDDNEPRLASQSD